MQDCTFQISRHKKQGHWTGHMLQRLWCTGPIAQSWKSAMWRHCSESYDQNQHTSSTDSVACHPARLESIKVAKVKWSLIALGNKAVPTARGNKTWLWSRFCRLSRTSGRTWPITAELQTIKVTFLILHHFPVLLPLCHPVVTPQGSAMAPQPRNATSRPAGATSRGGKAERHNGNSDLGYLVAFGWEPRPPRHNGGFTTGWHNGKRTTGKWLQNEKCHFYSL